MALTQEILQAEKELWRKTMGSQHEVEMKDRLQVRARARARGNSGKEEEEEEEEEEWRKAVESQHEV